MIKGGGGVVIQVENYIVNMDCGRAIDVDLLAEYGEAGIDIGFRPAKYRVSRPASTGRRDENAVVNVYPSGKLVCLGAKSVERARADMRMVLRRLGVAPAATVAEAAAEGEGGAAPAPAVRYVVMSGCIFGGHDAYKAIPRLREKYEVTLDSDVFSGYFVRSRRAKGEGEDEGGGGEDEGGDKGGGGGGGVSIQVFAPDADGLGGGGGDGIEDGGSGGRTPLLCRGPTVPEIRAVVGDVYRTIAGAGDKPAA